MNTCKLSRTQSFPLLDGAMKASLLNIKLHTLFCWLRFNQDVYRCLAYGGAPIRIQQAGKRFCPDVIESY